jgi:hypothetical protein
VAVNDRTFSAGEFAQLNAPDCPVCGTKGELQRLDVTLNEAQLQKEGRRYIPGLWSCPHGCNPNTGQQFHGGQQWETEMIGDGVRFVCSCGVEERHVPAERMNALLSQHEPGTWTPA